MDIAKINSINEMTEELVFKGKNNQALTNSLLVAEKFGKEHRNVVRDIRSLLEGGVLKNEQTPMFEETTYVNEQNKQTYPMYVMNRDGFTLLAMGFTGEKAMRFKMEYIRAFNKMEEVLRHQFSIPQTFSEALMLAASQAKRIEEQQETIKKDAREIVELASTITQMEPKATYYDTILASKGTCTVTQIAQDYAVSAKNFNKMLADAGIQRKVGGQWILYSAYLSQGYVHSRAIDIVRHDGKHETKYNTEWTAKGRIFLYNTLKKKGIVPAIER